MGEGGGGWVGSPDPINLWELKLVWGGEVGGEPHSILYWVEKDNPRGPTPSNPANDPQYPHWEYSVRRWVAAQIPIQQPVLFIQNPGDF